jgi:hypothetical protein
MSKLRSNQKAPSRTRTLFNKSLKTRTIQTNTSRNKRKVLGCLQRHPCYSESECHQKGNRRPDYEARH